MLEGHRCQLTHPSWTCNPSPYQEMAGLEEDQGGPSKPGSPGGLSQELVFFLIVKNFNLFLYFGCAGFSLLHGHFSSCGERGLL